ncbi:hypothetical protein FISHEDRAFT_59156, partial [Fistulina hepatica ATCC 64428]
MATILPSTSNVYGGRRVLRQDNTDVLEFENHIAAPAHEWCGTDCRMMHVLCPMVEEDISARKADTNIGAPAGDESRETYYWVVTSPNMPYTPEPVLGDRAVQARLDGRFGPDDCSQWPQFFVDGQQWVSLIPRPIHDPARPGYWLFQPLQWEDTYAAASGRVISPRQDLRTIKHHVFKRVHDHHYDVMATLYEYCEKHTPDPSSDFARYTVASFVVLLQHACDNVDNAP